MKKILLPIFLLAATISLPAQQNEIQQLEAEARARGIADVDIPGYVKHHLHHQHSTLQRVQQTPSAPAGPADCSVLGVEAGNFNGWSGYIGDNTISSYSPLQNIGYGIFSSTMDAPLTDINARHTIMSSSATADGCSGILPVHFGSYSVRLGNNYANYMGEQLSKTFIPGPSDSIYYFSFISVLNDGGHVPGEQPYFYFSFFDSTMSQYIDSVYISVGDTFRGDTGVASVNCFGTTYYGWHTDTLDFSSRIGHVIKFEIITAGCIYAGHFAYAYFDFDCSGGGVGIAESSSAAGEITPNPSQGKIKFVPPHGMNAQKTAIRITDISGRTILPQINRTDQFIEIDLGSSATGMYFLRAEESGRVVTSRIVIE